MKKIAFFDTKPYDRVWFEQYNKNFEIDFFEEKLNFHTAKMAEGFDGVCAFVNDDISARTIDRLHGLGVQTIAMRCAGYNNVDMKAAEGKITVSRVPAYSPYSVAEHAMGMLLMLNRKLHKAYIRTRDFNFNISGLEGVDLHRKTAGVIGTGKIGRIFINICRGFGMKVIAYDAYPAKDSGIDYVDLDTLFKESDVISLHCPLTEDTHHILDKAAFEKMKPGVFIINTSRGGLVDAPALLDALNSEKVRAVGLDVYEEEADLFFEDNSDKLVKDKTLALLLTRPNVLITSHQAFLTREALQNIAEITLQNLEAFFDGKKTGNEICAKCCQQ